jgi:hypothetical protein
MSKLLYRCGVCRSYQVVPGDLLGAPDCDTPGCTGQMTEIKPEDYAGTSASLLKKSEVWQLIVVAAKRAVKDAGGQINKKNAGLIAKYLTGNLIEHFMEQSRKAGLDAAAAAEIRELKKEVQRLHEQQRTHSSQIAFFLDLCEKNGIKVPGKTTNAERREQRAKQKEQEREANSSGDSGPGEDQSADQ